MKKKVLKILPYLFLMKIEQFTNETDFFIVVIIVILSFFTLMNSITYDIINIFIWAKNCPEIVILKIKFIVINYYKYLMLLKINNDDNNSKYWSID